MMSNLFQLYSLKIKSLFDKEALLTSDALAPDAPYQVHKMLGALESASIALDSVAGADIKFAGNVRQIAEDINPTLEAIAGIGFALKDRASRVQSGLFIRKGDTQKAYKEFIEKDFYSLLKSLEHIRECNKKRTGEPMPSLESIKLSPELAQFARDTIERIEAYDPLKDKAIDIGVNRVLPSLKTPAAILTILGVSTVACPPVASRLSDGARGHLSEARNEPYSKTGTWLFHNDFAADAQKHVRMEMLANRLKPAFADNGMRLNLITQAELHDPNNPDPNNKEILNYAYNGYQGALGGYSFKPSSENDYKEGTATHTFTLTGVVILSEDEYNRVQAFLSDPKSKGLPGIDHVRLYSSSPFKNPPAFKPVEFKSATTGQTIDNPRLLVISDLEKNTPTVLTSFFRTTLPAISGAAFAGKPQKLELEQIQGR